MKRPRELAEHRVRLSGSRAQGAWGHQRLSLVQLELAAERLTYATIALAGEGLDPALCDHSIGFPLSNEARDDLNALARDDDEARTTLCERGFERAQRVEKELHPVWQLASAGGREEIGVEHEQRDDLAGRLRGHERRVVGDAQVLATKPDNGSLG